jgi:predicted metal-dependent enzyme (double-stranded beta helix superfamily)
MITSVSHPDEVITAITDIVSGVGEPGGQVRRVQEFMSAAVVDESWVPGEFKECSGNDYTVRPLHVDPAGRFTICVMAWSPGQTTAIHDHIAWCVATVCHGTEIEDTFDLQRGPHGKQLLRLRATQELNTGDAVIHLPVEGDIHRVTCGPRSNAVSIHVYGCDISVAGSSIRATFDKLPIVG